MSIEVSIKREEDYFLKESLFQSFRSNLGVVNLSRSLNKILLGQIKTTLPYIKRQLQTSATEKENSATSVKYISDLFNNKAYQALVYNLINKFCQSLEDTLRGSKNAQKIQKRIYGGAKISYIFETEFKENLLSKNVFDSVRDDEIFWTIKNAQGLK